MEVKTCTKCFQIKTLNNYDKKGKGFTRNDCKECVRLYGIEYRKVNRELINKKKKLYNKDKPEIKHNSHLKHTYGITLSDYNNILKLQNYCCAICKTKEIGNNQHKNLHLDHCHKTNKIRGILCSKCNYGLGNFKDNIESLKMAIEYLQKVHFHPIL